MNKYETGNIKIETLSGSLIEKAIIPKCCSHIVKSNFNTTKVFCENNCENKGCGFLRK